MNKNVNTGAVIRAKPGTDRAVCKLCVNYTIVELSNRWSQGRNGTVGAELDQPSVYNALTNALKHDD